MKNLTIEIPRTGASVELILRTGASSGQAVIVASEDVEIRLKESVTVTTIRPALPPIPNRGNGTGLKPAPHGLNSILKRLLKLKPTKRATAVNSIKAMFQFTEPMSDATADKIFEDLRGRGSLSIDTSGKIQFHSA